MSLASMWGPSTWLLGIDMARVISHLLALPPSSSSSHASSPWAWPCGRRGVEVVLTWLDAGVDVAGAVNVACGCRSVS